MAAPPPSHAQPVVQQSTPLGWQPLAGPSGSISQLAAELGTANLYAAIEINARRREDQTQWSTEGTPIHSAALYRSHDSGATWQPATNNLISGPITALFADPGTGIVYAGLQGASGDSMQQVGLWASTDQGAHWQQVQLGQEGLRIERISRNAPGTHLLLGASETASGEKPASYVLRSSDGGTTWESTRLPLDEGSPQSVLADLIPHPSAPNQLFVTTHAGEIYTSDDLGRTWRLILDGSRALAPQSTPSPNSMGSLTSNQSGTSEVSPGPVCLAVAPDRPNTLLAARAEPVAGSAGAASSLALQLSGDDGTTWRALAASGLPVEAVPNTVTGLGGDTYLFNTNFGTYRSTDGGITWQLLEGPLSSGDVAAFVTLQGSPAPVVAATGYGLFTSKDAGAIWQSLGKGLPFNSHIAGLLTDARQPTRVFAITHAAHPHDSPTPPPGNESILELSPPMLLRSADGGATWIPASQGLPDIAPMAWALDPSDPNILYISSREHLFHTTDAGLNWQTSRLRPGGHYALAVAPSDSNILYLGGTPPLRSTDKGLTWQELPNVNPGARGEVTGLAVDPADAAHLWAAVEGSGVYESEDAGQSWQPIGLPGKPLRWLTLAGGNSGSPDQFFLYAGVGKEGIYRWDSQTHGWTTASNGLPAQSTILAFLPDSRQPGILWASRDGGGIYRSTDFGANWSNVSDTSVSSSTPNRAGSSTSQKGSELGLGNNLTQALAVDQTTPGGVLLGTASAGVWALRANSRPSPTPRAVDARIEIVWPHDNEPVSAAGLANIGLRLFAPNSLLQPPCGWRPEVTVWQALDNNPAEPLEKAEQRSIQGHPFPYWELNDVDVSRANDPQHRLYYMIRVLGTEAGTSIWAHSADARTFYPYPDVPSGVAVGDIAAVDARILIVWPHDGAGAGRSASDATHANVAVALFKHGTRLSVPVGWQPLGLTLYGAWNQEIGRPLTREAEVKVRTAGAITYPTWEFNNIPVAQAANPANKLHLWVMADDVDTYPTIWTHGAAARTFFPAQDEPAQGCIP